MSLFLFNYTYNILLKLWSADEWIAIWAIILLFVSYMLTTLYPLIPTLSNEMLTFCEPYAIEHNIVFNPNKTWCRYFRNEDSHPGFVYFMNYYL